MRTIAFPDLSLHRQEAVRLVLGGRYRFLARHAPQGQDIEAGDQLAAILFGRADGPDPHAPPGAAWFLCSFLHSRHGPLLATYAIEHDSFGPRVVIIGVAKADPYASGEGNPVGGRHVGLAPEDGSQA